MGFTSNLFFDEDERDNQYIHPYFHYIPRCQNYYYYYSVLSFNLTQVDILLLPVCSPPHAKLLLLLHQLGPHYLLRKFLQQMSDSLFAKNLCLLLTLLRKTTTITILLLLYEQIHYQQSTKQK